MSIIICPSCSNSLTSDPGGQYTCVSGHSFDRSKEGYLNLLLANKKKSIAPGDNNIMIDARRAFLEAKHYNPLIAKVKELLPKNLTGKKKLNALDVACGEGYYTAAILNSDSKAKWNLLGIDISKYAIRKAAKKYKEATFLVASAFDLPIAEQSIDLMLSIFGPIDSNSFNKVLSKDSYLICVTAGENHMKEMALLVYDQFRSHKQNLMDKLEADFVLVSSEGFSFGLSLNTQEEISSLLKMTPYYYNCNAEKLDKILKITDLKLTCDFNISIFRPK